MHNQGEVICIILFLGIVPYKIHNNHCIFVLGAYVILVIVIGIWYIVFVPKMRKTVVGVVVFFCEPSSHTSSLTFSKNQNDKLHHRQMVLPTTQKKPSGTNDHDHDDKETFKDTKGKDQQLNASRRQVFCALNMFMIRMVYRVYIGIVDIYTHQVL